MPRFEDPAPLQTDHPVNGFQCGVGSLDSWIVRYARQATSQDSSRVYVVTDNEQDGRVVGFHALAASSIEPDDATERAGKGMSQLDVPAVLIARLAVDQSVQRKGLGAWLLQDAMRRAISLAEEVGIRVILVHALNDDARNFYLRFDFEISPSDPMNLQLLLSDARKALDDSGPAQE